MYSRNYTTGLAASAIKLNPNAGNETSVTKSDSIPIRRFTDNFAYERFNRMGNTDKKSDVSAVYNDITQNEKKTEIIGSTEEDSYENTNNSAEKKEQSHHDIIAPENNVLSRLKLVFDTDTLLIILAAIMLMFSDNATNDKLTPLALLAILFL